MNKKDPTEKKGIVSKGTLLDDEFKTKNFNNLLIYKQNDDNTNNNQNNQNNSINIIEENQPLVQTSSPKKKPFIDRSFIDAIDKNLNKYTTFLEEMKKSNEEIKNKNEEERIIDQDIFMEPTENEDPNSVLMDVSLGVFDVGNNQLTDDQLKKMNITVSEVNHHMIGEQTSEELIQEL